MYVGDDTGLIKKVSLKFNLHQIKEEEPKRKYKSNIDFQIMILINFRGKRK